MLEPLTVALILLVCTRSFLGTSTGLAISKIGRQPSGTLPQRSVFRMFVDFDFEVPLASVHPTLEVPLREEQPEFDQHSHLPLSLVPTYGQAGT